MGGPIWVPVGAVTDHAMEDCEQLSHAGHQRHLRRFIHTDKLGSYAAAPSPPLHLITSSVLGSGVAFRWADLTFSRPMAELTPPFIHLTPTLRARPAAPHELRQTVRHAQGRHSFTTCRAVDRFQIDDPPFCPLEPHRS